MSTRAAGLRRVALAWSLSAVFGAAFSALPASAAAYNVSASPGSLVWLKNQTGSQMISIRNSGSTTEKYSTQLISYPHHQGINVRYFGFGSAGSCPIYTPPASGPNPPAGTLTPGQSCTIEITYSPNDYGELQGTFEVLYGPSGNEYVNQIPLAGYNYAFQGMYTLDAYGGVHGNGCVTLSGYPYWPGWRIARALALISGAQGGYVLDGYGGVHAFGTAAAVTDWPRLGADIALDIKLMPVGTNSQSPGGYVLDAFGGIHAFGGAPAVNGAASWSWKAAKKMVILPNGTGGYVLDLYGGLHPFGIGGNPPPAGVASAYWPGQDMARDVDLDQFYASNGMIAGLTLDAWGGVHPFGVEPAVGNPGPRWPYQDVARALRIDDLATEPPEGWILDKFGGLQSFAQEYNSGAFVGWNTIPVPPYPYWGSPLAAGMDIF